MKWTLPQLKRQYYTDNTFEARVDLSAYIPENSDILDIALVDVKGQYAFDTQNRVVFDLIIDTKLTMACARSLVPIEVPLHIETAETFSEIPTDETHELEGITVDLSPIVWSNIYLEKPLRVVHPDAIFEDNRLEDEEKPLNPMFKDLEKFK